MKVYIVTTGSYSDYSIKGVFSSVSKANQYIEKCRAFEECWLDKDFNSIEEYEMDSSLKERAYEQWAASLFLDTGEVIEKETSHRRQWGIPQSSSYVAENVPAYGGRSVVIAVSHKSAAHAHKVAVEARQEWPRKKGTNQ